MTTNVTRASVNGPGGLPSYIEREHDRALAEAVQCAEAGQSRMIILVGTSSTGKTRACWEAVQPLSDRAWNLWHPFDPTRAAAALADLQRVQPRTVVWLNEAQHYLGDPRHGEQIAAAIHTLLTAPDRRPVLILGTLWPAYANQYQELPKHGQPDPHSRVRELLAGRILTIPDRFSARELDTAKLLAAEGDQLLAGALTRVGNTGRLAQDLAGAPELLRRYEHGTPPARALLEAAMDARRLGADIYLPYAFLRDAAIDYLSDQDLGELADNWAQETFTDLTRPVHGKESPMALVPARPQHRPPGTLKPDTQPDGQIFKLADYLEQIGRTRLQKSCPPASFWHAAYTHFTEPETFYNLAQAAEARFRLQWAHHLLLRAVESDHAGALFDLAQKRNKSGDYTAAEEFYLRAASAKHPSSLIFLARMWSRTGQRDESERILLQISAKGDQGALLDLAILQEEAGRHEEAEKIYSEIIRNGNLDCLTDLSAIREDAGRKEEAEKIAWQIAESGYWGALINLAWIRKEAGDPEEAERIMRRIAVSQDSDALMDLALMREEAGDHVEAIQLFSETASAGNLTALLHLARILKESGARREAEELYRDVITAGNTMAMLHLATMRAEDGYHEQATKLLREAADAGQHMHNYPEGKTLYERWPNGLDPDGRPSPSWPQAGSPT
ncbi:tetratricopeptide repeat protein [Streptomyces sp. NPDC014894]|uniref:tetratricopeptide repeat protein n=1 Tax=Streptomyces sp. NPDC014894 TaxID=3364931 RepID=UPI003702FE81